MLLVILGQDINSMLLWCKQKTDLITLEKELSHFTAGRFLYLNNTTQNKTGRRHLANSHSHTHKTKRNE